MNNSEIKEMTTSEIEEQISEDKVLLTKLKLNHAVSPLENPHEITNMRRGIARLWTELRNRDIIEAETIINTVVD